jgi:nucleoside-diphosphate-sugar epimerase
MASSSKDGRSRRVLVTGASGSIGPRVVALLHEQGWHVRVLTLEEPPTALFHGEVQVIVGDITDASIVREAVRGVGAIIHMAARLHVQAPSGGMWDEYERVNVRGTANVVQAAVADRAERLLFFSTTAVYGASPGVLATEATPPTPGTAYARSKLAAEQLVLRSRREGGQPLGTVLRLAAVYGSRVKGNYRTLVRALARRRFVPVGNGRNRRVLIYERDVAAAALLALSSPEAAGAIYNVTDQSPHTMREIIAAICAALGYRPPRLYVPTSAARMAAGLVDGACRLARFRDPGARAAVDKFVEDLLVSGERLRTELGFRPAYSLDKGWRETVKEMDEAGEL